MMANRIMIPEEFRNRILKQLHRGHPGIDRMKSIARSHVFWPKLDKHIVNFFKNCVSCMSQAKSPCRLQPQPWPQTTRSWERIHIDFSGPFFDKFLFIVVDAYSKWPEVRIMPSATTSSTIEFLEELIARYGIHQQLFQIMEVNSHPRNSIIFAKKKESIV